MKRDRPCLCFIGSMAGDESGNSLPMGRVMAALFKQEGFEVIVASCKVNRLLRLLDIARTLYLERSKIDILIIQVYSGLSFVIADVASWMGRVLKLPIIFHVHGGNIPSFIDRHPAWVGRVMKRASRIVAPSHYLANSLLQHGFVIALIPNVIELSRYAFVHRRKPVSRLVWLRAFHDVYNPSLAAGVLSLLNGLGIHADLVMIGPDKRDGSLGRLMDAAERQGVSQQIRIIPGIPNEQVPEYLARGDIFLNTTNIDNTPVSVIEAMACGLCIVSTNVGGIPYLLEDETDALLVPPNDPSLMAGAVQRILMEPALAGRLSENARRKAGQFDWSVIFPEWVRLFEQLMNAHGRLEA